MPTRSGGAVTASDKAPADMAAPPLPSLPPPSSTVDVEAAAAAADGANNNNSDAAMEKGDDEPAEVEDVEDITQTEPAWSDKVKFDQLSLYDVGQLAPRSFYSVGNDAQKPITLMAMGLGVEGFPNPAEKGTAINKTIGRSNGHMFTKSEVDPSSSRSKPHLQKEVMRRVLVGPPLKGDAPKAANWSIAQLLKHLKEHPPLEEEQIDLLALHEELVVKVQGHFLDNSGSGLAVTMRHLRLYECALHGDLRTMFKERNKQKVRHEICGKNSRKLPPSYYAKVADLHNSGVALKSQALAEAYGAPFDKEMDLRPPSEDHRITAQSVKERMTKWRSPFHAIRYGIRASGEGGGSIMGGGVKNWVSSARGQVVVAHGDATAYGFLRFSQEGLLEDILQQPPDEYASTMKRPGRINHSGKRKSSAKSSSGKKKKNDDGDGAPMRAVDLMVRMELHNSVADLENKLMGLRNQISTEAGLVLEHRTKVGALFKEYKEWKSQVEDGTITEEGDPEEYEFYLDAKASYEDTKDAIKDAKEKEAFLRGEVMAAELDLDAAKKRVAEMLADGDDEAIDGEEDDGKSEEDEELEEVVSVGSNDGSAILGDDKIDSISTKAALTEGAKEYEMDV